MRIYVPSASMKSREMKHNVNAIYHAAREALIFEIAFANR
jgi:hypothetical protein